MDWTEQDSADLQLAYRLLENPGLAAKLTALLGKPIEKGFELLPKSAGRIITGATQQALLTATRIAVASLDTRGGAAKAARPFLHKLSAAASGAAGGFFGLVALPLELPVSTTIMLRSIADIGRSQGEPLRDPAGRLACVEVFAFGGRAREDNAAETGYYAVRVALARAVTEAAEFIASKGVIEKSAPPLARLISAIAVRFGVPVTEKLAATAIPVIGAAGGAIINTMFIDHFQDMALGHFIVRRLERKHGVENVRQRYESMSGKDGGFTVHRLRGRTGEARGHEWRRGVS